MPSQTNSATAPQAAGDAAAPQGGLRAQDLWERLNEGQRDAVLRSCALSDEDIRRARGGELTPALRREIWSYWKLTQLNPHRGGAHS
jgi:hypothetical protein